MMNCMILIILSRYFCYMNICCEEKDTVRLLDKIDESAKRNNLTYHRNLLFNEFGVHNCFIVENLLSLTRLMWITLYHGHLSKMICCGISSYRALIVIDRKMINFRTRHSFIFYKNGIKNYG